MKATDLFLILALFILFEDVASQAKYQEGMCVQFQPLLRDGSLYCNRDLDPILGPDGKTHSNQCVMCREILRSRVSTNSESDWPNDSSLGKDGSCREYWPYFMKGMISCTRENNPVRDALGKQHNNKCMMCLQQFKNGGKMNSLEKRQPQYGNNEGVDYCYEYRSLIGPNGELTCTRENDPVRDAYGQIHNNKCMLCAEQFEREAREGRLFGGGGRKPESSPANGNRVAQGNSNQGNSNEKNCNQYDGSAQPSGINNPCAVERIPRGDYRTNTNCGGTGASSYNNENGQKGPYGIRKKKGSVNDDKMDCIRILADLKKNRTSCQDLWSPVCGTDAKTYSNKCFLCSEIMNNEDTLAIKHEGECSEVIPEMVDCSKYSQTRGRILCKMSAQEVCGTDGVTHKNKCMLCNHILKTKAEIGIKNIGPCPKI